MAAKCTRTLVFCSCLACFWSASVLCHYMSMLSDRWTFGRWMYLLGKSDDLALGARFHAEVKSLEQEIFKAGFAITLPPLPEPDLSLDSASSNQDTVMEETPPEQPEGIRMTSRFLSQVYGCAKKTGPCILSRSRRRDCYEIMEHLFRLTSYPVPTWICRQVRMEPEQSLVTCTCSCSTAFAASLIC